jgi:hypothetical protein
MYAFLDVAPSQYKTIEGTLNPSAFKLDVRKFVQNRVPDNLAP